MAVLCCISSHFIYNFLLCRSVTYKFFKDGFFSKILWNDDDFKTTVLVDNKDLREALSPSDMLNISVISVCRLQPSFNHTLNTLNYKLSVEMFVIENRFVVSRYGSRIMCFT